MGAALFYHLTRSPADALLPVLIGKSLAAGWRVELRGASSGAQEQLDRLLWQGQGFLPHGLAGGPHDSRQPVLLTVVAPGRPPGPAANGASCLITVEGVEIHPEESAVLERSCILFDGNDPGALERARVQWRALKAAGVEAQYWSEDSGRWERRQ